MPKKRMRLPNGFGSIVKLSGNRRNPYVAKPPVAGYKDNGQPVAQKPIGYYATYEDAYAALIGYRANPWDTSNDRLTFADVYERMVEHKRANRNKPLSDSTYAQYRAAYGHFKSVADAPFASLRTPQLQQIIEQEACSRASEEAFINLVKQMYKYATAMDIVRNDASKALCVQRPEDDEKGVPFTLEDVNVFKRYIEEPVVKESLILCYSGFRVSALTANNFIINEGEGYFKGGVKTAAGRDRIVPIHPGIEPLLPGWAPMTTTTYRKVLKDFLVQNHMDKAHTPHDFRHTFSWMCDTYGVDPLSKKLLMGHSLGNDVTDSRYGHRTFGQLRDEICKLEY